MAEMTPRTLSGFMELLPKPQQQMERMMDILRRTYSLYGFTPLDTPVIEAAEVLLAKGGGDRGMLYGQELDKHFETVRAGEAELLNLHAHKTGALIIAAVELGCAAAGVRPDTDTRFAILAMRVG